MQWIDSLRKTTQKQQQRDWKKTLFRRTTSIEQKVFVIEQLDSKEDEYLEDGYEER